MEYLNDRGSRGVSVDDAADPCHGSLFTATG
jgi:hypothetical protein